MSIFALGKLKKKISQPNASIEDMCIDYAQSVSLGLRYYLANLSKDLPGGGSPPLSYQKGWSCSFASQLDCDYNGPKQPCFLMYELEMRLRSV